MTNIQYTTSPGVPPQSMEDEFLSHKNGSEWWYCTGYLNDESGRLFAFQFTLAKVIVYGIRLHIPSSDGFCGLQGRRIRQN